MISNDEQELLFIKLGGSLITDKTQFETIRPEVVKRIVAEIRQAREECPMMGILLGHGSGSFGHKHAAKHGTRDGVFDTEQWHGFTQVSASATRLNRLVVEEMLSAGLPAMSFQPSASAICENGKILYLSVEPLIAALKAKMIPIVYGDVAFDKQKGGTIISTEEIFSFLALRLKPSWLLLAGETPGVLDRDGHVLPGITRSQLNGIEDFLGGSRGTDVTGGMQSKVLGMLDLVDQMPDLRIRILSGLEPGHLKSAICNRKSNLGTLITRPVYD